MDFSRSRSREEKDGIIDQAIFVLAAVLVTLRGEEVFKLVLGKVRDFMTEARKNRVYPRVVLPLRGRFKKDTGESFHFVVITARNNSGMMTGKWFEREIAFREGR